VLMVEKLKQARNCGVVSRARTRTRTSACDCDYDCDCDCASGLPALNQSEVRVLRDPRRHMFAKHNACLSLSRDRTAYHSTTPLDQAQAQAQAQAVAAIAASSRFRMHAIATATELTFSLPCLVALSGDLFFLPCLIGSRLQVHVDIYRDCWGKNIWYSRTEDGGSWVSSHLLCSSGKSDETSQIEQARNYS